MQFLMDVTVSPKTGSGPNKSFEAPSRGNCILHYFICLALPESRDSLTQALSARAGKLDITMVFFVNPTPGDCWGPMVNCCNLWNTVACFHKLIAILIFDLAQ